MIYFLKVQFVHPLSFLILRFTCKSSLNSWRINDTLIYRYTSQCDQRSCMFWIRTKAHKTFTNTKMKSEACLKRMEGSDTFPTFCSRGARTEAFGIFVRDGSCVALHRRFVGNFMTAGNFGISNPKRETHSRCEPEILKKNTTWKLCLKILWGPCTQVSNYQSSGDFLSRQRIEGHVWWWISYKGIGCLNNSIQGFCHDVAMISGLVTWGPTRTAIFWGTKPIDLWI